MKIHQKLNLGFLSIIGPIILISLLAVWLIEDRLDRLSDFHSSTLFSIQVISSGTGNAIQESFAYVISGNTHEKEEFLLWQVEIAGQLETFKRIAALGESGEEAEKALVDRIESGVGLIIDGARNMFDAYESTGSVDAEVFTRYEAAIDQTFQALDELIEIERTEVTDSQEAAVAVISLSENIILVMLIFGLVLTFVSARVITRFISRPLTQLRTASQALAQGDLDWKLETASKDEFGDLTHSFRHMAEQLKKSRDELEEQVRSRTLELQTTVEKLQEEVVVRKRAEEALSTTQQYLDTILLNLPVGVAILEGPEFRYYRINRQLAEMNGLSVEDHLGRPLAAVLPEAAPDIIPGLRHVLETGEPRLDREFSTTLPKDPEVIRHFIDSFFPIKEADGKPRAVGAVVLDITERKRAEEALQRAYAELEQRVRERTAELTRTNAALQQEMAARKQAEGLFRKMHNELEHLFTTIPIGLCLLDTDLRYVHINKVLADFNGPPAAEHIGRTLQEMIPDIAPFVEPLFRQVLETGEPYRSIEIRSGTQSEPNRVRDWLIDLYDFRSARGVMLGVFVILQDITARKQAQVKIHASEARLAGIIDIAAEAIVSIDEYQQILLFNKGAEKIFGYAADEIIGQPLEVLIPERFHAAHRDHVAAFGDSVRRAPVASC